MVWSSLFVFLAVVQTAFGQPALDQHAEQLLHDRLFQTNLRGPRWTGNDNQNVLTSVVATSMEIAGLTVETLNYTLFRWDPRWWSLSLKLTNGTTMGLPTTGYWPYSGDTGLKGVTAPVHDAGSYALFPNQTANAGSLDLTGLPEGGSILFFDNPSPTRNYSEPGYGLLGSSVPAQDIPELGNLTNPHWQSAKTLNWTAIKQLGVAGVVASWVNTSDENGALQFLPNDGAPGNGSLYDVPALYVGNSTGETIRKLVKNGEVESATVVLDAPSLWAPSSTVIGHLNGTAETTDSIIVYTHSDGPSIIEENGPILLLAMAEYFAAHPIHLHIDFVITTGHMSGGHLNESSWMGERPEIMQTAKAAIVCEHFGAIEWKDNFSSGEPVFEPTGRYEPMWTMVNSSSASDQLHQLYLDAFEGTPDTLRMAMVSPQVVNGKRSQWYGAGGSSVLGYSNIPTIGIIPQPDYLWAAMVDGGWSRLDVDRAVTQINVILRLIDSLDQKFVAGEL
ncbi:Elongation factor 2 [Mycena sanguinolenta]|uniref:Elongation factor 2 n=1 Tax=Mycena sanguinolenta TaxID=230812 RepID=A0A8H6Z4B5_9AGAR|nr:Elongation factor 2 [Mycena sanguinolenta]